ncbi:hypothetical protein POX_g09059 [Penicillium oxalicum]|uniref:hypothetical protein n=1 Tax=Penicillium oxalicum TaxID=69781 RepID=UPI0020B68957|nr:hypothetical protein POX_g09059 [Penicillium oxalicum]KAI2786671.1 hypothetical protein POX_g09059 [Penicillium oxalicum]
MLPPRTAFNRIPGHLRPVLTSRAPAPKLRLQPFTHRSRLLLSRGPGRPQLPFLSPLTPTRSLPPLSIHLRQHFGRLISTESRAHLKKRLSRGFKFGLSFSAILILIQIIKIGLYQEDIEHEWPTPSEWTWKSRWCLRSAQAMMHPEQIGKLMTNWPMVAGYLRELLERLENTEGEGQGIVEQDEGGLLVEGVGKMGLDVSAKSEHWRRGYFQALMGAAKAAENLDGWLTDRKQKISAPAEYVVGPSNPRPKPMPAGQKLVPREEDCEAASPPPETFYMKVLTTKGFDTRQKLDAALAYADWLDFKGLARTSSDMYTWALDIAAGGLSGDASKVVDLETGILKNNGSDLPSENILRVSTAMAVHRARQGDLSAALSLFTSVLKARRTLPAGSEAGSSFRMPKRPSNDPLAGIVTTLKKIFNQAEYPPALPSGDAPPFRTPATVCDEAGLMTYIGEILYASSSKDQGLAWTRDAVETAESTMLQLNGPEDKPARTRCAQCLRVGLENWKTMVSTRVAQAKKEQAEAEASSSSSSSSWLSGRKSAQNTKKTEEEVRRWEAEEALLEDRIRRLFPVLVGESGLDTLSPNSSLFV